MPSEGEIVWVREQAVHKHLRALVTKVNPNPDQHGDVRVDFVWLEDDESQDPVVYSGTKASVLIPSADPQIILFPSLIQPWREGEKALTNEDIQWRRTRLMHKRIGGSPLDFLVLPEVPEGESLLSNAQAAEYVGLKESSFRMYDDYRPGSPARNDLPLHFYKARGQRFWRTSDLDAWRVLHPRSTQKRKPSK